MESEKTSAFISYLDQRTTSVQEDTLRLIADDRRDEANFEKIRANIFQIVKTMLQASARISQEESEGTWRRPEDSAGADQTGSPG